MNPLANYKQWKAGEYAATADEWEDWAEKMVAMFEAELDAVQRDYTRYRELKAENAKLKREVIEYAAMKQYLRSGPDGSTKPMWHDVDEEEKERYRESVRDALLTEQEQEKETIDRLDFLFERQKNHFLAWKIAQLEAEITSLKRPCSGCGATLADCYDWRRAGKVACCPDCNHEALLTEQESG